VTVHVQRPGDLDAAAVRRVADGDRLVLSPGLLQAVAGSRAETLAALASGSPVYGVTTGMGSQADLAVGTADQPGFQGDLMLARAVGTAPWLDHRTVRAVVAVRLRTLLAAETGVSPGLVAALAALLDTGRHPAVPETGNGAAGEIIPLAHLGGFLGGHHDGLDDPPADGAPYTFGAKEGVAFLQGVPVATARALLLAADVRLLLAQQVAVTAAEAALVRAPRDPYHQALARGDDELRTVLAALRTLAGDEPAPRMLQAPVSFRVAGPALAHLLRTVSRLDEAVERALSGVTTSPALVDGGFLGTAGFDGFDLAASLDAVRLGVLHVAETGAARLHRMLDPRVTGLPPQLSPEPGRQAGLVAVHKRVVGLLHEARRSAAPASLGAMETSQGQEDVQSFGLEAARAAYDALDVLRDVTASELLAVHQGTLLDGTAPRGSERLRTVLHKASEHLGTTTQDRPFGREVTAIRDLLGVGWAHDAIDPTRDAPSHPPHLTT
jgi:histidine ammonia-lyase